MQNFQAFLLVHLFVSLVNLMQVRAVQQSLLLKNERVSIQTQLLQVSKGEEEISTPNIYDTWR